MFVPMHVMPPYVVIIYVYFEFPLSSSGNEDFSQTGLHWQVWSVSAIC